MGIETALLAPIIGGAAGLAGSALQAGAARSAANKQAAATAQGQQMIQQALDQIAGYNAPYRATGEAGLTRLNQMIPELTSPVTAQDIQNMPGYQFTLGQGIGAARQRYNVGGGGSNMDRAAQKFAADYTMGTAFPALLAQRSNIYNTLAGIAGIGQTAVGQQAQALGAGTGAMANLGVGGATALGAGQVGAANALAGGLGNIGNQFWMYDIMRQRNAGGNPTPGYSNPANLPSTGYGYVPGFSPGT
jgi:hypothetical protein